jgi:hypothetical protein
MDAQTIIDSLQEPLERLFDRTKTRGRSAINDVQNLIEEIKPELVTATQSAIESGGAKTDLNTLQAEANAVLARTMSNYDTFTATERRDVMTTITAILIAGVKLAL